MSAAFWRTGLDALPTPAGVAGNSSITATCWGDAASPGGGCKPLGSSYTAGGAGIGWASEAIGASAANMATLKQVSRSPIRRPILLPSRHATWHGLLPATYYSIR